MPIEPGLGNVVIEDTPEVWRAGNRLALGMNFGVTDEVIRQYRTGWRCFHCQAPQQEAFPKHCIDGRYGVCDWGPKGYPIRERQSEDFARAYGGDKQYGPSPVDDAADEVERQTWRRKTGIWLPGDA